MKLDHKLLSFDKSWSHGDPNHDVHSATEWKHLRDFWDLIRKKLKFTRLLPLCIQAYPRALFALFACLMLAWGVWQFGQSEIWHLTAVDVELKDSIDFDCLLRLLPGINWLSGISCKPRMLWFNMKLHSYILLLSIWSAKMRILATFQKDNKHWCLSRYHVDNRHLPHAALIPTTVNPLQPSFNPGVFHKLHCKLTAYLPLFTSTQGYHRASGFGRQGNKHRVVVRPLYRD